MAGRHLTKTLLIIRFEEKEGEEEFDIKGQGRGLNPDW